MFHLKISIVSSLELGFLGRRRCFEEVKRYVFRIAYGRRNLTLIDTAIRESDGVYIDCAGDLVSQLFSALANALPGSSLGIDLGKSRNGVVMVWRGEPVLHAVVSAQKLRELLLLINGAAEVSVGYSPHADPSAILPELKRLCAAGAKIRLIDEMGASRGRFWMWRKYPFLSEDEVDALIFTLAPGISLDICGKPF